MRKLILAGLTVCALIMPAAAADIAPYYRGPLEVQPVYWAGAYAGTDVGAAWSNAFGSAGAIGGLYAGYNWQFAPQWLLGVELDGSWTEFNRVSWLASIRGRVGFTAIPTVLLYLTGGLASIDIDNSIATLGGSNQARSGWVIGGGLEWAPWGGNILVRAEYLNYNFNGAVAGPLASSRVTCRTVWPKVQTCPCGSIAEYVRSP
jgi:outer membrane immunogenic protein